MKNNLETIVSILSLVMLALATIASVLFLILGHNELLISSLILYVIAFASMAAGECLVISDIVKTRQKAKINAQLEENGQPQELEIIEPKEQPSMGLTITKLVLFSLITVFAFVILILY